MTVNDRCEVCSTELSITLRAGASQASVDLLEAKADALEAKADNLPNDLRSIIETEIVALQLQSIDPLQVSLSEHHAAFDSFFDVFVEVDLPGAIGSRASQASVDKLEGKVDKLESAVAALEGKSDRLEVKLDELANQVAKIIELIESLPMSQGQGDPGGPNR